MRRNAEAFTQAEKPCTGQISLDRPLTDRSSSELYCMTKALAIRSF